MGTQWGPSGDPMGPHWVPTEIPTKIVSFDLLLSGATISYNQHLHQPCDIETEETQSSGVLLLAKRLLQTNSHIVNVSYASGKYHKFPE